jgi:hypothetical protein
MTSKWHLVLYIDPESCCDEDHYYIWYKECYNNELSCVILEYQSYIPIPHNCERYYVYNYSKNTPYNIPNILYVTERYQPDSITFSYNYENIKNYFKQLNDEFTKTYIDKNYPKYSIE